ncbi:hypothetical protein CPB85DRAFT_1253491 [Mucidula mucida]|nr:hypothetical protein CPB85DRAFT_1253491 [Mucidula mucida]
MDALTAIKEYDVLTDSETGDSTASSGQISPSSNQRASGNYSPYSTPSVSECASRRALRKRGLELLQPILDMIRQYRCIVSYREPLVFVADTHEAWASRTEKLLNEVMNLYYTRELLDNVLQRTSALADSHRLEYGMHIVPFMSSKIPKPFHPSSCLIWLEMASSGAL